MIVEIKHTATGAALYTATIPDDHPYGRAVLLGLAVREAVKNRADIRGADLTGADLAGAIWAEGVTLEATPLCLTGLRWAVWILDTHMQIGCELHTFAEWEGFDDRAIAEMDGRKALKFWRQWREPLLALCATRKTKADSRQPSRDP